MFNRKGNVGLITFSLILSIYLVLFLGVYYFTTTQKDNYVSNNIKIQVANSVYSLRSNLIDLTKQRNSTLIYKNKYDMANIKVTLSSNSIYANQIQDNSYNDLNISNLGVKFCSTYNITLVTKTIFYFNGTCISII